VVYLRRLGIEHALVDVGGEVYGLGRKPDGTPWRVLVDALPDEGTEPADGATEPCVLQLHDMAAATSGDRWHRFEQAGRRYSHTFDPRTGMPVAHDTAAVTVVAADAMHADAWATALTVMGGDDGFAFATRHGIAARFLKRGGDDVSVRTTSAFEQWVGA
jgi:thiamine biosynthesis lipoprotein